MKKHLLFILVALSVHFANAQWITNGPYSKKLGTVDMAAGSSKIIIKSGGSVYFSATNGANWVDVSQGLPPSYEIRALAISGPKLFAAASHDLYVSADNGTTWTTVPGVIPADAWTLSITVTPGGMFIITGTTISNNERIFFSTDNGDSWTNISPQPGNAGPLSITGFAGRIFEGTHTGVMEILKVGNVWGKQDAEDYTLQLHWINALAATDGILFCSDTRNIYMSADTGRNWKLVSTTIPSNAYINSLAVSNGKVFIGASDGLFQLVYDGSEWRIVSAGTWDYLVIVVADGENIFVSNDFGLFLSTDQGNSWKDISTRLKYITVNSMTISGSAVFANSIGNGLYTSTLNTEKWDSMYANSHGVSLHFEPICTSDSGLIGGVGQSAYLYQDNSTEWIEHDSGLSANIYPGCDEVSALAANGSKIVAGTSCVPYYDPGDNSSSGDYAIYQNCVSNYCGRLFLSTDNGVQWTKTGPQTPCGVHAVSIFENDIFDGTDCGLYVSTDNGSSWTLLLAGDTITSFAFSNWYLYAGTRHGVVILTKDRYGWSVAGKGLIDMEILSLVAKKNSVFAGTNTGGIFFSEDYGNQWSAISKGLPAGAVYSLTLSESALYAAPAYKSVWKRSLSDISTLVPDIYFLAAFNLHPNPASSGFTIETSDASEKQLQLSDINGKQILSQAYTGSKTTIDVSSLPSGIYMVNLKSKKGIANQKLVITK